MDSGVPFGVEGQGMEFEVRDSPAGDAAVAVAISLQRLVEDTHRKDALTKVLP